MVVRSVRGVGGLDGEAVVVVAEGGSGDGAWRRGANFCESEDKSKPSGVEGSGGSSEAIATRDW